MPGDSKFACVKSAQLDDTCSRMVALLHLVCFVESWQVVHYHDRGPMGVLVRPNGFGVGIL